MVGALPGTDHRPGITYPSRLVAWYTVGVLFLLYWLSIIDRLIISLLVDPIRADLGITDFQFSMLLGVSFAIFYALFGLPMGWLVDRFSRRGVIYVGVTIWSLATAACGLAVGYWQLFAARIGVGAGEAALSPAAHSMLADSFPRERLTFAMTVFGLGATLGGGAAYGLGGWFVETTAHLETIAVPVFGDVRPWQVVFLALGIPGLVLGLLMFTLPEPVRHGRLGKTAAVEEGHAFTQLFQFVKSRGRFFLAHFAGFPLLGALTTGVGVWLPAYMGRHFGWSPGEIGSALGVLFGAGGVLGMLVGGKCVDALFARGYQDAHMRWMMLCVLVAGPAAVLGLLSSNVWVFLGCMAVFHILLCPLPAVAAAALQIVSPNELRGQVSALYVAIGSILSISVGPSIVAAFTDFVFRDEALLGFSLALFIGLASPLVALLLWYGLKHMRAAVAASSEWS